MTILAPCEGKRGAYCCLSDPAGLLTLACVHEHVVTSSACLRCFGVARRAIAAGAFVCGPCEDGARSHRCPVAEVKWEPA